MAATVQYQSYQQCVEALRRANEVRSANGLLKRAIRAGSVSAADVLLNPPVEALSMPIAALLMAVPRFGEARVSRLLRPLHISPQRRIGRLTERERQVLAAAVDGKIQSRVATKA